MLYLASAMSVNSDAFLLSLGMVGMAEMFDKTWFVALVMAMRHEKNIVFWACFAALAVHVVIAAAFGYSIARMFLPSTLQFMAAALYGLFAILYAYDWYTTEADADLIAAGKDEVNECMDQESNVQQYGTVAKDGKPKALPHMSWYEIRHVWMRCFMGVFIAEWGDRTQMAMIGIHASKPLVPVMLGSLIAFGLLTLSAVIVGGYLGDKTLSESTVKAVCAVSFAVFTVIAVKDGMQLRGQTMPVAPSLY
jgi:putative Ca2+/H+ antiporter (TMEM165/GDT1 family)